MIVAVLDMNVLASGFIGEHKSGSIPGTLIRRWRAVSLQLVSSEYILSELAATFNESYFTDRLSAEEIVEALGALRRGGTIQALTVLVAGIASHEEDDPVLATALSARANYLVTGDKELRQLGAYGARACSSRASSSPCSIGTAPGDASSPQPTLECQQ